MRDFDPHEAGETRAATRGARGRRLFVGVDLDAATREVCTTEVRRLREAAFPGTWVPAENYHLTVAFIGVVDGERTDEIALALIGATAALAAFDVPLNEIGAFPNAGKPRVAWIGPAQTVPPFASACTIVRGALGRLGFTFDPHTDAHVTLARADGRTPLPRVDPPSHPAVVHVDALILYDSVNHGGGVRYEPLRRFEFSG